MLLFKEWNYRIRKTNFQIFKNAFPGKSTSSSFLNITKHIHFISLIAFTEEFIFYLHRLEHTYFFTCIFCLECVYTRVPNCCVYIHAYSFRHNFPNHMGLIKDHMFINFQIFLLKVWILASQLELDMCMLEIFLHV